MDDFLIESQDDLIKVTNPANLGHLDDEENYKSHSQIDSSSHQEDFEHFPDDEAAPPTPPPSSNLDSSLLDFDAKSDFPGSLPAAAPKTEKVKDSTMAFIMNESEKHEERNIEDDYLNPYASSNKYGNDEKTDKFISSEDLLGSFSPEHKSSANKSASSDVEIIDPVEPEPEPVPDPLPPAAPKPVVAEKKAVAPTSESEPKVADGFVDSDKVVKMFKKAGLGESFFALFNYLIRSATTIPISRFVGRLNRHFFTKYSLSVFHFCLFSLPFSLIRTTMRCRMDEQTRLYFVLIRLSIEPNVRLSRLPSCDTVNREPYSLCSGRSR
jgi:hypothetical protein